MDFFHLLSGWLTAGLAILLMGSFRTQDSGVQVATSRQEVARVAEHRPVHAAFAWLHGHEREVREWQMELTSIAAPPFGERQRAEWIASKFKQLGLEQVSIDQVGNVVGLRPGTDAALPLAAVTAHIDTVFPAQTPLKIGREGERLLGPGIADNGAGVAGMLALAAALQAGEVKHAAGILFVGNVGEEGEGDLRGIRYLFAESEWKDKIGSTIVLDGAGHETVVTQALGSRRFEVVVSGPGGHSWSDFGTPNPIVALARAVSTFSDAPIPNEPRTSINVGVVQGGTSVNSIPENASVRVDIRSAATEQIDRLERALRDAVQAGMDSENRKASSDGDGRRRGQLTATIRQIGSRPAAELDPDARLLDVVRSVDRHLGLQTRVRRASTDANIPLSLGREAVSLGAGGTGGGAHTLREWYDPTNRELGLKRVLLALLTLAGVSQ